MSGRTAPLQRGPATVVATSPPIVELAKLVGHFVAASYGVLSRTTVAVALTLLAPVSLLYGPIAYIFAPVIVLSRVLLDVFVLTPYAIITSVARNVYPIYVFVGSAVICALVLGMLARVVSAGLQKVLFGPRPALEMEPEAEVLVESKEKSAIKPATLKTRLRKRVSIKEERNR
ncbi:hypothetical protein L226DRAFT_612780 [Lentinus tigrinus ALCF2SS1-7]|uniref:Uncharacterized protein n=1 Tax=Lentinus tigrinus ALCF2SS1-6 TaxID=1328759 RepID=A0A5C2SBC2_9APHY|nr:hypothetical protein L227DRAFT_610636 [Lentinus tigrinus ALCF2SS1-6]RPD75128.1 hypothetical protein L226DRAFT_612780 [Lentinus tigrinus ALCF2SS1-7]